MTREELDKATILRGVVGSVAFGLNTPESDQDEMAVVIPPMDQEMGLQKKPFESHVGKTDQGGDMTYYSLRHFCKLACNGNPTIITLFYTPHSMLLKLDARGGQLRELEHFCASKRAASAFLGYGQQQRDHLTGKRGNGGHGQPRLDLIAKFGFDTKFAMHMVRLSMQGVEYLTTGRLELPMSGDRQSFLLALRNGLIPKEVAIETALELEGQIKVLRETSHLPAEPNVREVESWMLNMYMKTWSASTRLEDQVFFDEMYQARRSDR